MPITSLLDRCRRELHYGSFEEGLTRIMDSRGQVLRRKTVSLVKVLWQQRGVEEATCARTRCEPPIPSCLGMKIRSLVVYKIND